MFNEIYPSKNYMVSVIAKLYTGDKTNVFLNNEFQTEMYITNGIKQGCSGSTLLICYS